jgi:hypothetical protein
MTEDEGFSAGCGQYAKGGCGDYGWTERSRRARLLAALALAPIGAAPLVARSKPNFHRNNDRKSGCGLQGCAHCGLSRFFSVPESKSKPAPFTIRRVRHPKELSLKRGRVGHPPLVVGKTQTNRITY